MDYAYVGMIIGFAGNFAPAGWALCDGSTIPINGNETLFSLIGTTYGGDGINNFALPNLMQRVAVGAGHGDGLAVRYLGEQDGAASVTLTVDNLPQHTHGFHVSNTAGTQPSPTNGCTLSALDPNTYSFYDSSAGATLASLNPSAVTGAGGGGASHTNMMPYEEITYIIHLTGLYPQTE
jgi:microcystin-dependent protein